MASDPINLRGIVLQARDYKEKDKVISFLSSDSGVIDICVKGSSKTGNKLSALTIPFVVADVVVTMTGSFYYVKDYSIVSSNAQIMNSLEAVTVASHFSKILSSSYIDSTNSRPFYELMVYSLFYLSNNLNNYLLAYSAFNWRVLNLLGFVVEYDNCTGCHEKISQQEYYSSIKTAELYCSKCYKKSVSNSGDYIKISSAVISALNFFATADYKQLFSVRLDNKSLEGLSEFTTKYLSHQLEGDYSSLQKLKAQLELFKM